MSHLDGTTRERRDDEEASFMRLRSYPVDVVETDVLSPERVRNRPKNTQ